MKLWNPRRVAVRLILGILAILSIAFISSDYQAAAAVNIKPSLTVLRQNNNYYRQHVNGLAKRYRLAYSAQTSLTNNGQVRLYIATKNPEIKTSVLLAMQYWNQKLHRKTFVMGTKYAYTMTVAMSKRKMSAFDVSDAWWLPDKQMVQIRTSLYKDARFDLRNKMMARSTANAFKTVNNKTIAYSARVKNEDGADRLVAKFRAAQVAAAQKKLTAIHNDIVHNGLDRKARTFEYADTVAHELGHVLGLRHSANKADLMYWQSGTPKIYDYNDVKRSKRGFNLLTKTDTARATLAIKIYRAFH